MGGPGSGRKKGSKNGTGNFKIVKGLTKTFKLYRGESAKEASIERTRAWNNKQEKLRKKFPTK